MLAHNYDSSPAPTLARPGLALGCEPFLLSPRIRRFPCPNLRAPISSARPGSTSTAPGNSGLTRTTTGLPSNGSPAKLLSRPLSSCRSPGDRPCRESPDQAPIAWYARTRARTRGVAGPAASSWSSAPAIGKPRPGWTAIRSGTHRGGYTPFEFELTPHLKPGQDHRLVLRVDDSTRAFKLEGKQGYGNARGIWQTVYLEARPQTFLQTLHFTPDIDQGRVTVRATLSAPAPAGAALETAIQVRRSARASPVPVAEGTDEVQFEVPVPTPASLVARRPVSL